MLLALIISHLLFQTLLQLTPSESLLLPLLTEYCNLTARLICAICSWYNYAVHTVQNKWTQQLLKHTYKHAGTHTQRHTALIRRRQLLYPSHHKHRRLWMLRYLHSGPAFNMVWHSKTLKMSLCDSVIAGSTPTQWNTHALTGTANTITCNATPGLWHDAVIHTWLTGTQVKVRPMRVFVCLIHQYVTTVSLMVSHSMCTYYRTWSIRAVQMTNKTTICYLLQCIRYIAIKYQCF